MKKVTKKYITLGIIGISIFFVVHSIFDFQKVQPTFDMANISIYGNGTEPFWGFMISGSTLILKEPSDSGPMNETVFPNISINNNQGFITLTGEGIKVELEKRQCSDGMSDIVYTHSTNLVTDLKNYSGCANID